MKTSLYVSSFFLSLVIFTGCSQKAEVDQSKLCIYSNDEQAKQCKEGELAMFSPQSWGNEQLPLNVAAAYCDFNHEIMYNNSGVICVFTNKHLSLLNKK
jgi:hypothetical protein